MTQSGGGGGLKTHFSQKFPKRWGPPAPPPLRPLKGKRHKHRQTLTAVSSFSFSVPYLAQEGGEGRGKCLRRFQQTRTFFNPIETGLFWCPSDWGRGGGGARIQLIAKISITVTKISLVGVRIPRSPTRTFL